MRRITTDELKQWMLGDNQEEVFDFLKDLINEAIDPEVIGEQIIDNTLNN